MKKKISVILFLITICLFNSISVFASASDGMLTIKTKFKDNGPRVYKIWFIGDSYSEELPNKLKILKNIELDNLFGNGIVSKKTDDSGITSIGNLNYGVYYGVQIDSENEIKSSTLPFFFEITKDKRNVIVNPKESASRFNLKFKVLNIDLTNNASSLSKDAKFYITDEYGNIVKFLKGKQSTDVGALEFLKVNENGEIDILEIDEGRYKLWQIESTLGYQKITSKDFTVNQKDQIIEVENYKEDLGGMHFRKIEEKINANDEPIGLKGVIFKVLVKDGDEFKEFKVNGNTVFLESLGGGYFKIESLPIGRYALEEVKTISTEDKDYILNKTPIEFNVTASSFTDGKTLVIENKFIKKETTTTSQIESTTSSSTTTTIESTTSTSVTTKPESKTSTKVEITTIPSVNLPSAGPSNVTLPNTGNKPSNNVVVLGFTLAILGVFINKKS